MTARGVLAAALSWAQAGPDASATVPATSRARTTRSLRRRDKVPAIIAAAAAAAAAAASPHGDADARDHRQDPEDHEEAGHRHEPRRQPDRHALVVAALALRMRVAMAPVERAEAVAAALTAERIDVEAADQSLERADPRAASHALTPAARTPHVDMVQWSDAAARKHS